MIVGLLLLSVAVLLAYIEFKAIPKRKEMRKAIQLVTKKIHTGSPAKESVLIGAGSVGISLYDIYAAAENHEEVLNVLEQRFPHAVDDYNSIDWYSKIKALYEDGSEDTYVSAFAGQKAENLAINHFENQGLHAELFTSRTHPNDDLRVYQEDGSYTDYSVKSLNSTSHFHQEVQSHPESTHYVVNKELYDDLMQKGLIHDYQEKGITIIHGNYFNKELREEAMKAFDDLKAAGDIADHIPFVSASLFGVRTFKNIVHFKQGSQSASEFRVNVISDTFRLSTSGLSAIAGAKGGALIGTAFSPGIGTIIGGGIGAVVSAFSGTKIISWATNKAKWADIFKAQSHFGIMNRNKIKDEIAVTFANQLFGFHELNKELTKEEELLKRYESKFNPYEKEEQLNVPAILCHLHIQKLNNKIDQMRKAIDMTRLELLDLSEKLAEKLTGKNAMDKNITQIRFYGEIFLSNENLRNLTLGEETDELTHKYLLQKEKNPHYPTRYPFEAKDIFEGLAIKNYKSLEKNEANDFPVHNKLVWTISSILAVMSLTLITSTFKHLVFLIIMSIFIYFLIKIILNFRPL